MRKNGAARFIRSSGRCHCLAGALTALQRLSPVGKILVDAIAVHNHRSWVAGGARHGRGRSGSAIWARPGKARGGGLHPPEAFACGAQNLRGATAGSAFRNRDLVKLVSVGR